MLLSFVLALAVPQSACPTFPSGFADPALNTTALAFAVAPGELFIVGQFTKPGGRVTSWNGTDWGFRELGQAALAGTARAIARVDLGTGMRTVAGGEFPGFVAVWNGTSWGVPPGGPNAPVSALAAFDDGSGPSLYAGGFFATTGGAPIPFLARWNGSAWSPVGQSFDGPVRVLAVHDDGSGPALYAGGDFTHTGSADARHLARWDGNAWSEVGTGVDGAVFALASFQGDLYAGGPFAVAGSTPAAHVARWNGSTWSALGAGTDADVHALAVHDDGSGARLYVGGDFLTAGTVASRAVAAWDGANWSACENGLSGVVRCLASASAGAGATPKLYAGGHFSLHEGVEGLHIARWTGTEWRAVSEGVQNFADPRQVRAVATHDDGTGAAYYIGGRFGDAGGRTIGNLGRWNGDRWESMGGVTGPSNSTVSDLVVADLGNGDELLVGGTFASAGGVACSNVARWDGNGFAPIGNGLDAPVYEMIAVGSGAGARVYASTTATFHFGAAGNSSVAMWSGGDWQPVGALVGIVRALAWFDDGSGPALYAGGQFIAASVGHNVARWNGSAWVAVGTPTGESFFGVYDIVACDVGTGPALWFGGYFLTLGGVPSRMIGKWDGTSWSSGGFTSIDRIDHLAAFDDGAGRGRRLFAMGRDGLYVLDGGTWSTTAQIASAMIQDGGMRAFESPFDGRPELWIAGTYWREIGPEYFPSDGILRLRACDETGLTYCFGDGSEGACPCGNASAAGERQGCAHSLGTGGALRARGRASLTQDTLVFDGSTMPNSSALYFQGLVRSAPVPFGDGIKCTSGPFVRLATKSNVAGESSYPVAGDVPVSVRGHVSAPGTRHYQVRYRNAAVFCTSETFNYTNAVAIQWGA